MRPLCAPGAAGLARFAVLVYCLADDLEMSNNELLTDDYVAELLAQDAKDCSLKYSAMGMEAFREAKKYVLQQCST